MVEGVAVQIVTPALARALGRVPAAPVVRTLGPWGALQPLSLPHLDQAAAKLVVALEAQMAAVCMAHQGQWQAQDCRCYFSLVVSPI
jgi:hypothetical protein